MMKLHTVRLTPVAYEFCISITFLPPKMKITMRHGKFDTPLPMKHIGKRHRIHSPTHAHNHLWIRTNYFSCKTHIEKQKMLSCEDNIFQ